MAQTKTNILEITFIRSDTLGGTKVITIPTIPQSINYNYAPLFSEQSVLGRLTPVYKYSGGSGASLSFMVELHEDPHVRDIDRDKTLNDLVEDIKSLSAPTIGTRGKTSNYPRVYFELGDLKAFVKVETNIEWNKPFRQGRYIMATISFTLDIVEELSRIDNSILIESVEREVRGDVVYGEQGTVYTEDQLSYNTGRGDIGKRYGVYLNNLIITPTRLLDGNTTGRKMWDDTMERLDNLFGVYGTQMNTYGGDPKKSSYTNLLNQFNTLKSTLGDLDSVSVSYETIQELIGSLIDNHDKFMDYYYESINKEMTRPEREQIKSTFVALLRTLETAAGGVMGYGSTN